MGLPNPLHFLFPARRPRATKPRGAFAACLVLLAALWAEESAALCGLPLVATVHFKNFPPSGMPNTATLPAMDSCQGTWNYIVHGACSRSGGFWNCPAAPTWLTFDSGTRTLGGTPSVPLRSVKLSYLGQSAHDLDNVYHQPVTIEFDDYPPSVSIAAQSAAAVTEGEAAVFTVTSDVAAPTGGLAVSLRVADARGGGDFVAPGDEGAKSVTIAGGETTAEYRVATQDDGRGEANGHVTVTVQSLTATPAPYVAGSPASASVAVNDNDGGPPPPPPPPPTSPLAQLERATVDGAVLVLGYDQALDEGEVPAPEAYAVSVDGAGARAPASVSVEGAVVTLVLDAAVCAGERVALDYTPPASGAVRGAGGGGEAAALSAVAVENLTAPTACVHRVPLLPAASHPYLLGAVRVLNRSEEAGEVSITAFDDGGAEYGPLTLEIGANEAVHFNSGHLERGGPERGLEGATGEGEGSWRLELRSALDVEVLAYVRTRGAGALASMHEVAPADAAGAHRVVFFNPGSNRGRASLLRLVNPGETQAEVTIAGVDDAGEAGESEMVLTLGARASRTLTAQALETGEGEGLDGALGDGAGKWRLRVGADWPIRVMSLLGGAGGAELTNVSAVPVPEGAVHRVPLLPSASHPYLLGAVRVLNRSEEAGEVSIMAFDDGGAEYGPLTLEIGANEAVHFNSGHLERGGPERGLEGATGEGAGSWRLELRSALDVEVLAYARTRGAGVLASMHEVAPADEAGAHRVVIFNPGSNRGRMSLLRLVNPGEMEAQVTIAGVDDAGEAGEGEVALTLGARASRTLTAQALETGEGEGLAGALGDGAGKWRLRVGADQPIRVMSLLRGAEGQLTNLSAVARPVPRGARTALRDAASGGAG